MIETLTIHNYKCFEHQPLDLANLTLLAGLNGAGKSTAIQSLLLLRQSFEQGILTDVGLALNGEYVKIGSAKDALFEKAVGDAFGFTLKFVDGKCAEWRFESDPKGDVVTNASSHVDDGVFATPLFTDEFEYLQAERIGPRTSFPTSEYLVRRKKRLGNSGEYATHFLSFFGRALKVRKALHHDAATSSDLIDEVEAWMSDISPGTRLHFTPYLGMDAINLEYSFAYRTETTERYRATNVGFGITYTLPVLVAILSARPGALLLLENPEAHLHPKGQVMIGQLLATLGKLGVQVVVETHSDHVLNGIRLALHDGTVKPEHVALFYFCRELGAGIRPTAVTRIGLDSNGRLTSRPKGFFDEFSRSMDQLLGPPGSYGRSGGS